MQAEPPFKLIDLFAGAGGLTLGFTSVNTSDNQLAFSPVWANDFNKAATDTYNTNFGPHCVHGDIVDLLDNAEIAIPKADVVIGGPPCQGFSLLNKKRRTDQRKQLWQPFMEVVERSGARAFLMENVRQLIKSTEFFDIKSKAEQLGFEVSAAVLCAADYGVPQVRYRAFIVGSKDCSPYEAFPPKRTHYDPKTYGSPDTLFEEYVDDPNPRCTVEDAIVDLPEPFGTQIRDEAGPLDLHFGRNPTSISVQRYRAVPLGGNRFDLQRNAPEITPKCWIRKKSGGTDLFGRLWWDRPSVTIRTEFFKPEKGRYLHPVAHRPITHREAARLQSFPDDFKFKGSKVEIARQIGNAVPPLLGTAVARSIYALLSGDRDLMEAVGVREPELSPIYS